jgi:ABC-type oligopeptide transport system substrate-binding subunit
MRLGLGVLASAVLFGTGFGLAGCASASKPKGTTSAKTSTGLPVSTSVTTITYAKPSGGEGTKAVTYTYTTLQTGVLSVTFQDLEP